MQPTGVREAMNMPMPEALFENTSRDYATFNTNISDQYRFGQFEREFQIRYASGKEPLPQFIFIWLPNDHTADPRPADGYPYRASYVADNDLALGKLVQLFSHSPFWKDMAIFVTEDDAQDGRDHVDAHRSVLMVISPYARRDYVSHAHTSIASILKTFDLIFDLRLPQPVRRRRHRPRGFLHRSAGLHALRRAAQRRAHFRSRQGARAGIGLEGAAWHATRRSRHDSPRPARARPRLTLSAPKAIWSAAAKLPPSSRRACSREFSAWANIPASKLACRKRQLRGRTPKLRIPDQSFVGGFAHRVQ